MRNRFLSALTAGDCNAALGVIDKTELRENGMSDSDFCRFMNDWARPKFVRTAARDASQAGQWNVVARDDHMALAVNVAKTDDGPKVVQPIATIVVTLASLKPDHTRPKDAMDKLNTWSANSRRMTSELAQFHITKVQIMPEWKPMTLTQFADWCDQRLQKSRAE